MGVFFQRRLWVWPLLLILVGTAFLVTMMYGAADVSPQTVFRALGGAKDSQQLLIIHDIRLPRQIAAMLTGAALAVSGNIMQSLTRNPMADPGLLGLTGGSNAALAVSLAAIPALPFTGRMMVCFLGAAMGAAVVFAVSAASRGGLSPLRLILSGASVSLFLQALSEGIGLWSGTSKEISVWTGGGLVGVAWDQIRWVSPVVLAGLLVALFLSGQLTVLSLGDQAARGLGQNTFNIRLIFILLTVMMTGAAVALAGNLAFVGLVVPHVVRAMTGPAHRRTLPGCALAGAALMLMADMAARMIHAPYETPLAAVIGILGLPFFMAVMHLRRKEMMA